METDHQNATGIAAQLDSGILRSEQLDQLIMDALDNLLAWLDALNNFLPDGLNPDPFNEITRHLEIDVRFQQRQAHFSKGVRDIGFRNLTQPA